MRANSRQQGLEGSPWIPNAGQNLTAAGNSQGTALAIPAGQDLSVFTTVAASTGCILPANGVSPNEEYIIANHGSNALSVYPATNGFMGTASQNAAYSLSAGKTGYFLYVGTQHWTVNP